MGSGGRDCRACGGRPALVPEAGGEGVIMSVRVGAIVSMAVSARPSCSICGGVSGGMASFGKGVGVCLVGIKITPMSSSRGAGDVGVGVFLCWLF